MILDTLNKQEYFSDVDQAIAMFILETGDDLVNETVRSIARKVYVSPATVMRFFNRLGYSGYQEFKKKYLLELKYTTSHFQNINPNFPFSKQDNRITMTNKLATLYKETIDDVLSLMNYEMLKKALDIIKKANIIYIYSAGVQIGLCEIFKDKMIKIGKTVIVSNVIDELYYSASFTQEQNTFILVSYSGETRNIVDVAKKLKERKIPFISITSYGNHTLAEYSNCCLYVSTREKVSAKIGDYGMNISVLFLLDTLYSYYFNLDYHKNYKRRVTYLKKFEENRGGLKKTIKNSVLMDED